MKKEIKLIAFDLDGTLSNHKEHMPEENKKALQRLSEKYKLLMVGAGTVDRIFSQMEQFPIDIIGNYGMQYARYNATTKGLDIIRNITLPCKKEETEQKVDYFRNKYGFTEFTGDSVQYHPSGCITFAILGTKAKQEDKLSFDPDRIKRRLIYAEVASAFPDYCVFVGGSSSFDMAPKPYNKYYALDIFCKENGYSHSEVVFIGDDYGQGGNDESVYKSDFNFLPIDDYRTFPRVVKELL